MSGLKQQIEKKALRVCRVCGIEARTEEDLPKFKINYTSFYGREPICNGCWNKQKKAYADTHRDQIRKSNREYMEKYYPEHRQERIEYAREQRKQHPERVIAHNLGRNQPLEKSCSKCGSTENLVRHHPDYSKPKEVVTLCRFCHFQLHRGN